ncbi:uncharacterized protein LOC115880826 [Sitophilus oryzae]|uniref:Uncharacterized protein LOC115880826 n=1 Tax=Sitophilus oryzae TaxID=7048 RepID=A0A6J2XRE1_SITOR|nr:uncharacterized protein LOC115880826 [Sitophilus oryzae]
MDILIDNITSLFVFTFLFLIVYAIILNIYFINKNGFQIKVNCWFCNKNSKVLYANRNSFVCPFCTQYNGFNKEGDYNKVIQAQHNLSLNALNSNTSKTQTYSSILWSNNLCNECNRNQQLKILQLSKYEPLNEKKFDVEIEHFEKQLNKTYKLCKTCTKTVKSTIRKQNAWIFGNRLKSLKTLQRKGLSYLNLHKQSQGHEDIHRFSLISLFLLFISVINVLVLNGFDLLVIKDILPDSILPSNVIFSHIYSTINNNIMSIFGRSSILNYLRTNITSKELSLLYISLIGFSLEGIYSIREKSMSFCGKCNKLMSWIILGLTSSINFNRETKAYIDTLQLFCSLFLIYNYSYTCFSFQNWKNKKNKVKSKRSQLDSDDSENSDLDMLNNSEKSFQARINRCSPLTSNIENINLDRSCEQTKGTAHRSVYKNGSLQPKSNNELNEHFHSLNLGAFVPSRPGSCQNFQSHKTQFNPFMNNAACQTKPQSSNSLYNFEVMDNIPSSSPKPLQNNIWNPLFKLPNVTSNLSNNASFLEHSFLNEPFSGLNKFEKRPMSNQNISLNGRFPSPETSILQQNNDGFLSRDTSRVFSDNGSIHQSYSHQKNAVNPMLSQSSFINNSFRPLSPTSLSGKSNRTLISPPRLNHIKTFQSDSTESENLNLSFHSNDVPSSGFGFKMNNTNLGRGFVVNSLLTVQHPQGLETSNLQISSKNNPISRSSSSSSGFVSNGDRAKAQTNSLPNSRDHSPDRNSILSEPAFHYKLD